MLELEQTQHLDLRLGRLPVFLPTQHHRHQARQRSRETRNPGKTRYHAQEGRRGYHGVGWRKGAAQAVHHTSRPTPAVKHSFVTSVLRRLDFGVTAVDIAVSRHYSHYSSQLMLLEHLNRGP